MKVLLALSLLLFLDPVFSQGDSIKCSLLHSCPIGYTTQYSGPSMAKAVCHCKKNPQELSTCSLSLFTCTVLINRACYGAELNCSPTEIMNFCNKGNFSLSELCDRVNQRLRNEKNAVAQRQCEFFKNQCNIRISRHCDNAARTCDPDTIIQLCKNKRITDNYTCETAEIQKEKDRAEDTKYSCDRAKKDCLYFNYFNACSDIAKFCDVETTAKWCYKDDTNQMEKISDEDCSKAIKKSQYLTFGRMGEECWDQLPLCEGGDSEACIQVAAHCVKEVTSALCNAKKITSKSICKYAGLEKSTSSSYPGCKFFADKCGNREDEYCPLASRYCDDKNIADLCKMLLIEDVSICKRVSVDISAYFPSDTISTIHLTDIYHPYMP